MTLFDSFILGVVEGLTEFLPVSSTGHMILISHLLGLKQSCFEKTFEVAIQLGAILAVLTIYSNRLKGNFELWKKLLVAFLPTGIIGLLLHSFIKELFNPLVVSLTLIIWGAVFIAVEILIGNRGSKISKPEEITYLKAFLIGLFQSLAMVPGTSRSGATIVGGLLLGMKRVAATEFSFLLAIPTMFAATGFELVKSFNSLNLDDFKLLSVGFFTAFISAFLSVKWLIAFIRNHTFIPFGIYRIIVGVLFLTVVL